MTSRKLTEVKVFFFCLLQCNLNIPNFIIKIVTTSSVCWGQLDKTSPSQYKKECEYSQSGNWHFSFNFGKHLFRHCLLFCCSTYNFPLIDTISVRLKVAQSIVQPMKGQVVKAHGPHLGGHNLSTSYVPPEERWKFISMSEISFGKHARTSCPKLYHINI